MHLEHCSAKCHSRIAQLCFPLLQILFAVDSAQHRQRPFQNQVLDLDKPHHLQTKHRWANQRRPSISPNLSIALCRTLTLQNLVLTRPQQRWTLINVAWHQMQTTSIAFHASKHPHCQNSACQTSDGQLLERNDRYTELKSLFKRDKNCIYFSK